MQVVFKIQFNTFKKTHCISVTKILLIMSRKISAAYSDNQIKPMNTMSLQCCVVECEAL
jgi:hypothetical protein